MKRAEMDETFLGIGLFNNLPKKWLLLPPKKTIFTLLSSASL
jgi:hypothetical protein